MQCSDWTKKNSSTTTLPFRVESGVVLPEGLEGLEMRNSGDLRGAGADGSAGVETIITKKKTRGVSFRICISQARLRQADLPLASISSPASICRQCAAFPPRPRQRRLPRSVRL